MIASYQRITSIDRAFGTLNTLSVRVPRPVLEAIAKGRAATAAEIDAMTRELLALRDEEERRDDGTVIARIEHTGDSAIKGWFAPRSGRLPLARLHPGGRVTMGGRTYAVVSVEGDDERVVRVR